MPPTHNAAGLFVLGRPAVVGRLVRNERFSMSHPSEFCLDDGRLYAGAAVRLGARNVFGLGDVGAVAGTIALVFATPRTPLLAALTDRGLCPSDYGLRNQHAQVRSDWLSPERGFRTTRARMSELEYLQATSAHAVTMHGALPGADHGAPVVVELQNPFDRGLDGLTAKARYEGGPGKPMPKDVAIALSLPAGGRQILELPHSINGGPAGADAGEPRGIYWLRSVQLEGAVANTLFDVTIFVNVARRGNNKR